MIFCLDTLFCHHIPIYLIVDLCPVSTIKYSVLPTLVRHGCHISARES